MAGGFFSAVIENGCQPVVGASGGIFGLMGLFIADLLMNFRSLNRYVIPTDVVRSDLTYQSRAYSITLKCE